MAAKYSLSDATRLRNNGEVRASFEPSSTARAVDERTTEHEAVKLSSDRAALSTSPDDGDTNRSERPMSPGTLALMCDEKDPLFTAPPSPLGDLGAADEVSTSGSSYAGLLYAEQERAILLEYRDCLRRIISVGKRRGVFSVSFLHTPYI